MTKLLLTIREYLENYEILDVYIHTKQDVVSPFKTYLIIEVWSE